MKKQILTLWILAALTAMATFVSCEKDPLPEPNPEPTPDYRWTWAGEYNGDHAVALWIADYPEYDGTDSLMRIHIRDYESGRDVTMHADGTFTYDGPYSSSCIINGRFYANNDSLYIHYQAPMGLHPGSIQKEFYLFKVRPYYPPTE